MEDVTSEVVEVSFDENEVSVERKSSKGKKIGCGCGCGCLLIIIAIIVVIVILYKTATAFVTGFEEKGYSRQDGQVLVIKEDTAVNGPIDTTIILCRKLIKLFC